MRVLLGQLGSNYLCQRIASSNLVEWRYKEAFLLARRQRINLNLLVDHNFSSFIQNIQQFVSQV